MNIEQYHLQQTRRRYHTQTILLAVAVIIVLLMGLQTYFSFRPRAEQLIADYAALSEQADQLLEDLEELKREVGP